MNKVYTDYIPPKPLHPGLFIKDQLQLSGISLKELSKQTGIPLKNIKKIISEKKDLDYELAEKIGAVLDIPSELLIKMQNKYYRDLQIYQAKKYLKQKKVGFIRKKLKKLFTYFGINPEKLIYRY